MRASLKIALLASLLLAGCAQLSVPQPTAGNPAATSLDGTQWVLIEYYPDKSTEAPVEPQLYAYTLQLELGGAMQIKLNCNQASGKWQAVQTDGDGPGLAFGILKTTRAFCGDADLGGKLLEDFAYIAEYSIYDGRLTLTTGGSGARYIWDSVD